MQQNSSGQNGVTRPRVEPQYVRFVGDSVGVVNLTPEALRILSEHVTQVLLKIIHTSKQYSLHGRRTRLQADDVDATLRQLKMNIPYGAASRKGPQLRQFTTPAGEELYVREEYDIDIANLAEESKPKMPIQSFVKSHWLVYEGKIALVPENVRPLKEEDDDDLLTGESAKAAAIAFRRETAGGSLGASVSFRQRSRQVLTKEQIQIKAPIVESLTLEQQIYIKDIVEAVVGHDEGKRLAALASLETDTGLQPILPKLSRLVNHSIRYNILAQSMPLVIYLVRIYKAFSLNQSLTLESVLHEIIPTMLSCILCENLCRTVDIDTHWTLRDFASKTLCSVISAQNTPEIKERTLRVIKQAWNDPKTSIVVKFGCIYPLLEFLSLDDPFNSKFLNDVMVLHQQCTSMQNNNELAQVERTIASRLISHLLKLDIASRIRERREKVLSKLELLERRSDDSEKFGSVPEIR